MNDFLSDVEFKAKTKLKPASRVKDRPVRDSHVAQGLWKLVSIFATIIVTMLVLRYGCESAISFSLGVPHQSMKDLMERMK